MFSFLGLGHASDPSCYSLRRSHRLSMKFPVSLVSCGLAPFNMRRPVQKGLEEALADHCCQVIREEVEIDESSSFS
jgi:hypothetical protein